MFRIPILGPIVLDIKGCHLQAWSKAAEDRPAPAGGEELGYIPSFLQFPAKDGLSLVLLRHQQVRLRMAAEKAQDQIFRKMVGMQVSKQ